MTSTTTPDPSVLEQWLGVPLPDSREAVRASIHGDGVEVQYVAIAMDVSRAYVDAVIGARRLAPSEVVVARGDLNPAPGAPGEAGLRSLLALQGVEDTHALVCKLVCTSPRHVRLPARLWHRFVSGKPLPPVERVPHAFLSPPKATTTIYVGTSRPLSPIFMQFLWYQDGRLNYHEWES